MGTPPTDYTLVKLDKIEDLVREVKHILLDGRRAVKEPSMGSMVASRLEGWLLSSRPILMGLGMIARHVVAVATIWYLIKTGQAEQADPYIKWLLGL